MLRAFGLGLAFGADVGVGVGAGVGGAGVGGAGAKSSRASKKSMSMATIYALQLPILVNKFHMKPARGPKQSFFSNYCNGIPGLANYEMPNEVCECNFGETFSKHRDSRPRGTAVTGQLG